jgi:EAL domain-containing protein (putative c-di-GMP-specific phosphodiesterase class I)
MSMTRSVLIVDDEEEFAGIIAELLQDQGFRVEVACDKKSFLYLARQNWDCILMDLMMPQIDGIEAVRHLADNDCKSPLIMISGFSQHLLQSSAGLAEVRGMLVVGTLNKPFDFSELVEMVNSAVESRGPDDKPVASADSFSISDYLSSVDRCGVIPYYQPKVDARTGELKGYEALARWWHPERGILPPSAFLQHALDNGHAEDLTMAMVDRLIVDMKHLSSRGINLPVALNIEADSLREFTLPNKIEKRLAGSGVSNLHVILEVTENGIFEHLASMIDNLVRFRLKGFEVAIDDFGTGHSSLTHLQSLPVSQLKIDRSFVAGIGSCSKSEAIITASIDLARKIGLDTVAEGIETEEQAEYLRALGCDQLQGYLYGRPMNAADVAAWRSMREEVYSGGAALPEGTKPELSLAGAA